MGLPSLCWLKSDLKVLEVYHHFSLRRVSADKGCCCKEYADFPTGLQNYVDVRKEPPLAPRDETLQIFVGRDGIPALMRVHPSEIERFDN